MSDAANPFQTVMGLMTAFWASRCVHVVAQLGVADALGDEAMTTAELAAAVKVDASSLGRVLRLLAAHGIFERTPTGFRHNAASRLLRSQPPSLRAFAQMIGGPLGWGSFGALEHAVRTGEPGVRTLAPGGLFEYFPKHPEEAQIFNAAMTGKSLGQVSAVVSAYDFSKVGEIADIGGGAGHLLRAVLEVAPNARGILFDLPHVIKQNEGLASPRLTLQAGDFFKDALPSCEMYVIMEVIHDWADAEATQILKAVRRACRPTSKLLIVEHILPDDPGPHWAKSLDITMLTMTGGLERTRAEYEKLLTDAGFNLDRVVQTPSGNMMAPLDIIEATPR